MGRAPTCLDDFTCLGAAGQISQITNMVAFFQRLCRDNLLYEKFRICVTTQITRLHHLPSRREPRWEKYARPYPHLRPG